MRSLGRSSPSPEIWILLSFEGVILKVLCNLSAKPKVSKPGPRLALVAGTEITTITP